MEGSTKHREVLSQEYCPPLDESLFLAIVSEYNLDAPEERRTVIDILSSLKKSALAEDSADFDPSGSGGFTGFTEDHASAPSHSTPEDNSVSNDETSITTGLFDLHVDGANVIGSHLEVLSQEDKLQWLKETFPDIISFEVTSMLKKCNGNLNNTIDQLLNLSFLPRSVDGFEQDEHLTLGRKGRGKKKSRTSESSRANSAISQHSETSLEEAHNIWAAVASDVEFVCARTILDNKTVKSAYHANGMSLPATIRALGMKQATTLPSLANAGVAIQIAIADLKQDFQTVPEAQLHGVLDLARNIPSAAHELVEVMVTIMHSDTMPIGKVNGFAQYASVKLESSTDRPSTPSKLNYLPASTFVGHSSYTADYGLAASDAFQQASSAYRRGKSDRLVGGAAAYYSQVGHEHMRLAKQKNAAEANTHVASQSSASHVDLHGVGVLDAVRIARDRTETWWEGLGDARYYPGDNNVARSGFRIVTGAGKHSKDGALRIGPAVSKMLMREGWRAEVLAGEIIVKGKTRS